MEKKTKYALVVSLIVFLLIFFYFGVYAYRVAYIGMGYKAKILCSAVFISGRDAGSVLKEDLSDPKLTHFQATVDTAGKKVIVSGFGGLLKRIAYYRDGLGATLDLPKEMRSFSLPRENDSLQIQRLWPDGEKVDFQNLPKDVDRQKLKSALEWAFIEPDSQHLRRTRAVVIVYKGRIIGERYADGFDKDMPLLGWSMTKSVTNALIGIRVKQGKLNVDQKDLFPEWRKAGDQRKNISLKHLLQMSSGLEFQEKYTNLFSDVVVMLYREKNTAKFAIEKPLVYSPGMHWSYSSGTTNIVSQILRDSFQGDDVKYWNFPRKELFQKIGMRHTELETDAVGTFVGSSYLYATARDWARFGLLFLQDGVWKGEQILPTNWVEFSVAPAPAAPDKKYGAFWWLGPQSIPCLDPEIRKHLPKDLYSAEGHEGQFVTIIPSKELIVVRLGLTKEPDEWDQGGFIYRVMKSIHEN